MNFTQEFNAEFGDRFENLELKDVVVKKADGTCTITFLSLSTTKEISDAEKQEITDWLKEILKIEYVKIKVKFMRVYVEEKLILKELENFFKEKYKIVTPYISEKSFDIKINTFDVLIDVKLSSRMVEFFSEHKIASELSKHLKQNFLVDFTIVAQEDAEIFDEVDIENVELKTSYKPVARYKVEIIKEVIGKDINPNPEYIFSIKKPKPVAIIAGYIKKIERREFIRKTGKYAGQPKGLYSIQITDGKGKMDCVYFASKANEKVMESLEETMYVVMQGEVKLNYMNKLSFVIKKLALATEIEKHVENKPVKVNYNEDGSVVKIESLTFMEQDNMFSDGNIYSDKIKGKTIVVFDLETTGLDFDNDQITEIGAVKIVDGQIKEKFSTFVKPTIHIPAHVTEITGITEEMVKDAPPVDLVIRDFFNFTRGCVLSGHNILEFDLKFIKRDGKASGFNFDNPIIDTIVEARRANLGISRFNLSMVVKTLGLTLKGAHRAWNDAYATAQVLLKLNEINRK